MEPIVEKITLVEDARFDSPKSMFLGRVMGKSLIHDLSVRAGNAYGSQPELFLNDLFEVVSSCDV